MLKTNDEQFDALKFLDDLIKEMNMQNEDPAELAELKENMAETLNNALFKSASENIEPEVIDSVMNELKDEKDALFIITQLIQTSPGAQIAMIQALDNFRKNTLDAYKQLK